MTEITRVAWDLKGRELSISLAAVDGFPLLLHAGSPGSRVLDPSLVLLAAEYGFRLVSYDRPGYGRSAPRKDRRVGDGAAEASAIADQLGWERFATWGFSGGGPYALACAALVPDRLTAACVFASLGPRGEHDLDFAVERPEAFRNEIDLYFSDQPAARRKYRHEGVAQLAEMSQLDFWLTTWGERAGIDAAHGRALAEHLAANTREAARQGDEGWWEDWSAFLSPWGFNVADIQRPVQLWHGSRDRAVPQAHGRWLAEHIGGVEAHLLDDEDHSTIEVEHRVDALRWLRASVDGEASRLEGRHPLDS